MRPQRIGLKSLSSMLKYQASCSQTYHVRYFVLLKLVSYGKETCMFYLFLTYPYYLCLERGSAGQAGLKNWQCLGAALYFTALYQTATTNSSKATEQNIMNACFPISVFTSRHNAAAATPSNQFNQVTKPLTSTLLTSTNPIFDQKYGRSK